ncbi:Sideroflexin-1 [Cichlidogyrus casuarinus]|uniref:Sideroflexin-1 n=1 Tax=Cichlidogyrus casuarinus TaxID=1844966 RepID=A0ABD2PSG1_9PLAT
MSPDGMIPVAIIDGSVITGLNALILRIKNLINSGDFIEDINVLSEVTAGNVFFSWLAENLRNISLYLTWLNNSEETRKIYEKRHAFPVSAALRYIDKRAYTSYLKSIDWNSKSINSILKIFEGICVAIAERIGTGEYILGRDKPGKCDSLLYGYWKVFKEFGNYFSSLHDTMSKYPSIEQLFVNMQK